MLSPALPPQAAGPPLPLKQTRRRSDGDIGVVQDLATAQDGADAHQQLSDSSFGSKTDGRDARSLSPTVQTDVNMDCAQLVSKVPVKSDGNAQKIGKTRRNSLTAASDPAGWYKLHQLLGQGSFGQVWKAVDRDTGRPLAVKIYKPSKLKNGDIKKMVEAEIRIMRKFDHPNVVSLIDTHTTFRGLHIVMEFAEKGSLFAYVRKLGKLDEQAASFIFRQIAAGALHIQSHSCCHRDIKLENVLFFSACELKLVDFGLAGEMKAHNSQLSMICGSLLYMAPEMFRNRTYNGRMIDVWSLGVVLFLMVMGRFPFRGLSEAEVKRKVMTEKLPEMKTLTPECMDLLRRMLCKRPEERISMEEVCRHGFATQELPVGYRLPGLEEFYRPMSKTNAPNVSGPGEPDKLREIALSPPALPCAEEGDEGKDDEKGDEEEEGLGLLAASVAARAYVPFIRKPADDVCVELGEEDGEEEEVERQEAEKEEEEVEQEGKAAVPPSVPYALELRSLLADLLDGPPPVVSSPPAVCASPPPSRVSPPPRRQPPAAAQQRDPRRSMPTTTQGRLLPHQPRSAAALLRRQSTAPKAQVTAVNATAATVNPAVAPSTTSTNNTAKPVPTAIGNTATAGKTAFRVRPATGPPRKECPPIITKPLVKPSVKAAASAAAQRLAAKTRAGKSAENLIQQRLFRPTVGPAPSSTSCAPAVPSSTAQDPAVAAMVRELGAASFAVQELLDLDSELTRLQLGGFKLFPVLSPSAAPSDVPDKEPPAVQAELVRATDEARRSSESPPIASRDSSSADLFTLDADPDFIGIYDNALVVDIPKTLSGPLEPRKDTIYSEELEHARMSLEKDTFWPYQLDPSRHKKLEDYKPTAVVTSFPQLQSLPPVSRASLLVIDISDDTRVGALPSFGVVLSLLRSLEVLALRRCGLKQVDGAVLPRLVRCDLSGNDITDITSVRFLAQSSDRLIRLDLQGNPCQAMDTWNSARKDLLCALPYIQLLDDVPVPTPELLAAVAARGTPHDTQRLSLRIFSDAIVLRAAHTAQSLGLAYDSSVWDPSSIVVLDLSKQNLQCVCLSTLTRLREVNLSHNCLDDLSTSGLAASDDLRALNLSHNRLSLSSLSYFSLLPALEQLFLVGNTAMAAPNARLWVVYWTLFLRGKWDEPGLASLDGKPIITSERVRAVQCCQPVNHRRLSAAGTSAVVSLYRWRLEMTRMFGQTAVNGLHPVPAGREGLHLSFLLLPPAPTAPGPLALLKRLVVQGTDVELVDVRGLAALETLDLRHNALRGVGAIGLGALPRLRILLLAGNPDLDVPDVIETLAGRVPKRTPAELCADKHHQAAPVSTLEILDCATSQSTTATLPTWWQDRSLPPHITPTGASVDASAAALIPHNRFLWCIDSFTLPPTLIASCYQRHYRWKADELAWYLSRLAVVMSALPRSFASGERSVEASGSPNMSPTFKSRTRSHHPDDIAPSFQYDATQVFAPLNLSRLDLLSTPVAVLCMTSFVNVSTLNLSHNHITDLLACGIEHMTSLTLLDLHSNAITTATDDVARVLNRLPRLKSVAVRRNPFLRPLGSRKRLITLLSSLAQLSSPLCVVDEPITVEERIQARAEQSRIAGDGSESDADTFRFQLALLRAVHPSMPPTDVLTLDLSGCKLARADLGAFVNLRQLNLSQNRLTPSSFKPGYLGIPMMTNLISANLSGNNLQLFRQGNPKLVMPAFAGLISLTSLRVADSVSLTVSPPRHSASDKESQPVVKSLFSPSGLSGVVAARFNPKDHLRTVLSHLSCLSDPWHPLREVDGMPVHSWDVTDALYAHPSEEKEDFRFNICFARAIGAQSLSMVTRLDLSHCFLEKVDGDALLGLAHLEVLLLHDNALSDTATASAGFGRLRVRHLDLRRNNIVKHTTIGQVIQGNRFLQALWLEGNPCFKPPTYDSLIKVLGRVSRCSLQGFKLDIDGTSVTVDDRISAVRRKRLPISLRSSPVSSFVEVPEASTEVTAEWPASLAVASTLDAVQYSDELVERLRLALTVVDTARSSGEDTSLDLSASKLVYIADLAWHRHYCVSLTTLNLSHNSLSSLVNQGLQYLRALRFLDIRHNALGSLTSVLDELGKCGKLTVLFLENCTGNGETRTPAVYTPSVFQRLRGLAQCDNIHTPAQLCVNQPAQVSALQFLDEALGLSANSMYRVDVSGCGLTWEHFGPIVAALAVLPVTILDASDNPFVVNCDGRGTPHRWIALRTIWSLVTLDDLDVDEHERENATRFVDKLPRSARDSLAKTLNWKVVGSSPGLPDITRRIQELYWSVYWHRYSLDRAGRCGPFGVGEDPDRSVQFAVLPPPPRSCLEDASGAASSQSPLRLSPGAPATDLLNVTALQLSEAGNVDLLRQMASNNGMSTAYSERLSPPNLEMAYPGSLMNKLEALVNFFQVYAMIILLTWTTLWPDTWRDVKSVYDWPAKLLTLDLVGAFAPVRIHLSPAAQSYTRFAVLMCLPLVLLAAYLKVKSLDPSLWIRDYVLEWRRTRALIWRWTVFVAAIILLAGLFVRFPRSLAAFGPTRNSATADAHTLWAICGITELLCLAVYWACVLMFRRKYLDRGADRPEVGGESFQLYWSQFTRTLKRCIFFVLTIAYLPIARAVLENFAGEYDAKVLKLYGCANVDNAGFPCCLQTLPTSPCLNSPAFEGLGLGAMQYIAIVFGCIYVLGIPMICVKLIFDAATRVDKQYIPFQQFELQNGGHASRTLLRRKLTAIYARVVDSVEIPQKYLYQAYRRPWRFFKIYQMLDKLALLCISLYSPQRNHVWRQMTAATLLAACGLTLSAVFRPHSDPLEALFDATCRLANVFNCGVGLIISLGLRFPGPAVDACLLVINGGNLVVFVVVVALGLRRREHAREGSEVENPSPSPASRKLSPSMPISHQQHGEDAIRDASQSLGFSSTLRTVAGPHPPVDEDQASSDASMGSQFIVSLVPFSEDSLP